MIAITYSLKCCQQLIHKGKLVLKLTHIFHYKTWGNLNGHEITKPEVLETRNTYVGASHGNLPHIHVPFHDVKLTFSTGVRGLWVINFMQL
jgi:hypothetical protein